MMLIGCVIIALGGLAGGYLLGVATVKGKQSSKRMW